MEYNKHVLNSNNVMRTTWKLINKELGMDNKNHGIQSVNIDGRSAANQQIIPDAFNKHFTSIPNTINRNITANYCVTKTSANNQNTLSCYLKHAFQNSFPSIKCNCTTTKETENIIMSFNGLPKVVKDISSKHNKFKTAPKLFLHTHSFHTSDDFFYKL